ncbi:alanine racemase [Vibrio agarivorans]|uniref:alanine racemase n=1 Tax=Vibrio agarivorans TaxID=153622 RepID=UPI00223180CC|nr:alanine racemase [Vibrio agarivorans]MDN3660092.1 alanine racemase [Vibrio agarivorans]
MQTPTARINLNAIKHNYSVLKELSGNQKLIAVIKGNAYGHDANEVAHALPNADAFAVARIEEAINLRRSGIEQPILLLEGCFCHKELLKASQFNLDTVVHSHNQLEDIERFPLPSPIKVWLKVDTGMHRLGVQPQDVEHYMRRLEAFDYVAEDIHFLSHLSCADNPSSDKTASQISVFSSALENVNGLKSLANSAGILLWPNSQFDVARAGIALFGISPQITRTGKDFGLIPAMTFETSLISKRDHQKGQAVGYGETWVASQDTTLGVIAVGYGDGYPRSGSNNAYVYINGRLAPVVGRVSMDMIVVDLGPKSKDQCGDIVELWGNNLPIEHVAKSAQAIPYELTIQLTSRVSKEHCFESIY